MFIKIGVAQPIVKQYVAVDVEVFREMQEAYSLLKSKLREIKDLEHRVSELERQLKALKNRSHIKEVQDEEDEYF